MVKGEFVRPKLEAKQKVLRSMQLAATLKIQLEHVLLSLVNEDFGTVLK